ncbi:hypothetical protein Y032_0043g884 [Ancylostoma ceylanicum]|nr:hypothetical protein Y032_0043g884 [Ancylostoma ceylanicum]
MNPANRVSTRSTRKSKSRVPTPRKLIESVSNLLTDHQLDHQGHHLQLTGRISSKKLGDGVLEAHKEFIRESPTFFAYWKEENIPKNLKQDVVFLYDWNRVVLNDSPDYYHASYVDGCTKQRQYIMAQAPFDESTQADFFRMLSQTHPDAVVFMDAHDSEDAKYIFPSSGTYGGVKVKVEDVEQGAGYAVRTLVLGKTKIKVYCINGWTVEKEPPKDFIAIHEKIRSNLDAKSMLMLVCKDGCSRSGIFCLLDIEAERYRTKGRIKLAETIKTIRYQRSNCFDTPELFEAGTSVLTEFAKKALEKVDANKA